MSKRISSQNEGYQMSQAGLLKCIDNFNQAVKELDRITNRTTGTAQEEALKTVQEILAEVEVKGDPTGRSFECPERTTRARTKRNE